MMLIAAAAATGPAVPGVGMTVRAVAGMLFVLGLVAALAWLARRGALGLGRKGPSPVRIEHAAALGDRRSLAIVSVEGRRLLLGLTPAQITLVTELAPGDGFARALDARVTPEPRS
jgi:flagellar biosynthetic protein FliO